MEESAAGDGQRVAATLAFSVNIVAARSAVSSKNSAGARTDCKSIIVSAGVPDHARGLLRVT